MKYSKASGSNKYCTSSSFQLESPRPRSAFKQHGPPLNPSANSSIDSSDLPPSMRNVLSTLGTGAPEQRPGVSKWQLRSFEDAESYISDVRRKNEYIVPLGILNGSSTRISLQGYVLRQGYGENDFCNSCIMNTFDSDVSRKISIVFLGVLLEMGMAVLLDNEDNVWLHSSMMIIDYTIPNFDGTAGIVLKKDEFGSFERITMFDRMVLSRGRFAHPDFGKPYGS